MRESEVENTLPLVSQTQRPGEPNSNAPESRAKWWSVAHATERLDAAPATARRQRRAATRAATAWPEVLFETNVL